MASSCFAYSFKFAVHMFQSIARCFDQIIVCVMNEKKLKYEILGDINRVARNFNNFLSTGKNKYNGNRSI
jgi:hypothetical protein